ncbi:MAG TPA: nucleoside hydrolase [Vicinamibacteria bacterium]|nr:nucleoside hydrolase [Vicinamibacteria bacterium]
MAPRLAFALPLLLTAVASAQPHGIIFDTDFILPPGDDGMALLLALQSSEVEILGITTVAGNESLERGTSDVLRLLEIVGRADIPVYRGADMPLVHEKSDFAVSSYGKWWSDEPSPLNVSRKTKLTKKWYDEMVATETPITALLRETMGPRFKTEPERDWLMYDQVAMASLIDRTLVTTKELYVDVDINHGINYGVSVGGTELWPGAEGAKKMNVQYDLDWPRFIEMFVSRVRAPLRKSPGG